MARIDRLDPEDRTIVRRASVLGLSFHPRFLPDVLSDEVPAGRADLAAPGAVLPGRGRRLPALPAGDRARRRVRRPAVPDAAAPARRGRRADGARVRVDARRGRRPAVAALPPRGRAREGLALRPRGGRSRTRERRRSRPPPTSTAVLWMRLGASTSTPQELASAWEDLGEARARAGEVTAAVEAFSRARRLLPDDRCAARRLMHRTAWVHERVGRTTPRSAGPAADCARSTARRPAAARERAGLTTTLAAVRRQQGRASEAERLCREAIARGARPPQTSCSSHGLSSTSTGRSSTLGRAAEATHSEPRARDLHARRGHRAAGGGAEQPRHVRLLGGSLAGRGRAVRARRRGQRAGGRRLGRRLRRLQHRRGARRPGAPGGSRGAPAPGAADMARHRGRARRRVHVRAARAPGRARRAPRGGGRTADGCRTKLPRAEGGG